jgi:hypothetical protein
MDISPGTTVIVSTNIMFSTMRVYKLTWVQCIEHGGRKHKTWRWSRLLRNLKFESRDGEKHRKICTFYYKIWILLAQRFCGSCGAFQCIKFWNASIRTILILRNLKFESYLIHSYACSHRKHITLAYIFDIKV